MAFLGGVAPAEIASLAFGKGATRAQPALDMLSAYGDPEWFSGTGRECGERLAHLPAPRSARCEDGGAAAAVVFGHEQGHGVFAAVHFC